MKALSLRQPWAWAVVHGGKTIESRRWTTRFRGPFLIHAAKGMTRTEYLEATDFILDAKGLRWDSDFVPMGSTLERGGIIGRARLVDVVPPCVPVEFVGGECACARAPWHMGRQYGFVLEDVEPLPFFACRGELGFFEVAYPFPLAGEMRTKGATP